VNKAYIFETSLFCAVDVVIAKDEDEAIKFLASNHAMQFKTTIERMELSLRKDIERGHNTVRSEKLRSGLLVTGGGNG
jgi:hypothetical protein